MQWYCALKCHEEPIRSTDVLEGKRVVSSMTSLSGLLDIICHFTPFWTFSCFRFSIFAHRKSAWWIVKLPISEKYWIVKWTCNVNLVQMFQYTCEFYLFIFTIKTCWCYIWRKLGLNLLINQWDFYRSGNIFQTYIEGVHLSSSGCFVYNFYGVRIYNM